MLLLELGELGLQLRHCSYPDLVVFRLVDVLTLHAYDPHVPVSFACTAGMCLPNYDALAGSAPALLSVAPAWESDHTLQGGCRFQSASGLPYSPQPTAVTILSHCPLGPSKVAALH